MPPPVLDRIQIFSLDFEGQALHLLNADAGFPVCLYKLERHAPTGVLKRLHTDGADHGDDTHFIFGCPFSKGHPTDEERVLSLLMMKYWPNFAHTGVFSYSSIQVIPNSLVSAQPNTGSWNSEILQT
ncbi:carboxylesterase 4A-like [Glossophaga mutica]